MEWIQISTNKLKIMLTAEDTRHYELDCEGSDYADVMTRAAFRDILRDVRKKSGFDASEDKVYIQMYPSKEGGCELFVTKIGLLVTNSLHEELPRKAGIAPLPPLTEEMEACYIFDSLQTLLSLCRVLRDKEVAQSSAFRDERGRWWLSLTTRSDPPHIQLPFLKEYGREVAREDARRYLGEHASVICERAVEKLSIC